VTAEYTSRVTIGLITKYGVEDVYLSIKEALKHAGRALSTEVQNRWLDAETYSAEDLSEVDGVLIPGGFGMRGIPGKIRAIQYAREHQIPFLGICLGFQMAVVEYARDVLGYQDAISEEFGPGTHVIAILPEQEEVINLGGTMRLGGYPIEVAPETMALDLYGSDEITERHRHRYEVNPDYIGELEGAGLVFSGKNGNRMEILELPGHPFFFATQFHPEFRSRPTRPSPPYLGFVNACRENKNRRNQR
jgi:CTP synthase